VFCPAPLVTVVSPIGAGDSLVGGLVHALEAGQDWPAAVRYAIAVASASCEQDLAGGIDVARVAALLAPARQKPAPQKPGVR
jgi:sugar/nucleoside kinase (ribokinase family)